MFKWIVVYSILCWKKCNFNMNNLKPHRKKNIKHFVFVRWTFGHFANLLNMKVSRNSLEKSGRNIWKITIAIRGQRNIFSSQTAPSSFIRFRRDNQNDNCLINQVVHFVLWKVHQKSWSLLFSTRFSQFKSFWIRCFPVIWPRLVSRGMIEIYQ